jgi:hypothetical protein
MLSGENKESALNCWKYWRWKWKVKSRRFICWLPEEGSVPIHQVPPPHMINVIPHRSHCNNNALSSNWQCRSSDGKLLFLLQEVHQAHVEGNIFDTTLSTVTRRGNSTECCSTELSSAAK